MTRRFQQSIPRTDEAHAHLSAGREQAERKRAGGPYLTHSRPLSPCQTDVPISDSDFHGEHFLSLSRLPCTDVQGLVSL